MMENQPLVSVPVITYNSSKYVIETLESIKAQTYQNLELIISDDCSTDDTVELCMNWIEKHKERFVRTKLLTAEKNKGTSANINRAEAECEGEWIKEIAGDDLLVPECLEFCMDYVSEHPDAICLFGRQNAFGVNEERCKQVNEVFDYSFFNLSPEEQLHRLIFVSNCVPATTFFFNKKKLEEIGVKNDERIPLLEDWPKWINLLKAGVKFDFVDRVLVCYRVGGISTSTNNCNLKAYKSGRLFLFYYLFQEWVDRDRDSAIIRVVNEEVDVYEYACDIEKKLQQIQNSKAYRLGKAILFPFSKLKRKLFN